LNGAAADRPGLVFHSRPDGKLELDWFGHHYLYCHPHQPFTENEVRLVAAIGSVLSARYRSIFSAESAATTLQLFRGLPEDRFVSAFLDPFPYLDETALPTARDYVADAIEVLRESSLLTYENRRISTGALLLGSGPDLGHDPPAAAIDALSYSSSLTSIKSFHRLCDGLQTVCLVNREGLLVDLVDIRSWSRGRKESSLPAPCAAVYRPHTLATLRGGHVCLALTPNGEIKIFAHGTQVFNFLNGRWRLTDVVEKFNAWERAVGDPVLAERLFIAALNLAEDRRGGLFVVLDDPKLARQFVAPADLLDGPIIPRREIDAGTKDQIHYLLRHKRVLDLAPAVLETTARMDGSIVLDRASNLLAFGAILRQGDELDQHSVEGGRTTAAISGSKFGDVLKISEDGLVSFYRQGGLIWEL
jgi:hypothetical protein